MTEHVHRLITNESSRQCIMTLQNGVHVLLVVYVLWKKIWNVETKNAQDMINGTKSIGRQRQIMVFPDSGDE